MLNINIHMFLLHIHFNPLKIMETKYFKSLIFYKIVYIYFH